MISWDDALQHLQKLRLTPRAVVLSVVALIVASSYRTIWYIIRPYLSSLRALKGPDGGSFLFGNLKMSQGIKIPGLWQQSLVEKYGHVLVYKVWLNQDRLVTTDHKALHHILTNSNMYEKPSEVRYNLGTLLGKGLLFVEGQDHKRQRRVMNPAFGLVHIRDMTEIFVTKSLELREALVHRTDLEQGEKWTPVDMLAYVSCTTLDIMGLAGFNYSFNSVQQLSEGLDMTDNLSSAARELLLLAEALSLLAFFKMFFPIFRLITWDARSKIMDRGEAAMREIGRKLVDEKRRALNSSYEKEQAKDLLTLLIKANMNEGGRDDRSMSDDEVMNQIPTFLMAGHETTSTSTTWALFSLATHPEIQDKLRKELLTVSTENPTMDELNALPYLERVVRETLRYHSVVAVTTRVATQHDMIPVDTPFEDKYGNIHYHIKVAKGDIITIPMRAMNSLKSIWGPDAEEFNPDRWLEPPKATSSIPAVWGNQLSFLGGPRSCIGFRFALVEMKVLLFELIRSLEFKLAVSPDDIVRILGIVSRPKVRSQLDKGHQMPMLIRRIK